MSKQKIRILMAELGGFVFNWTFGKSVNAHLQAFNPNGKQAGGQFDTENKINAILELADVPNYPEDTGAALACVGEMKIAIANFEPGYPPGDWRVSVENGNKTVSTHGANLSMMICECILRARARWKDEMPTEMTAIGRLRP